MKIFTVTGNYGPLGAGEPEEPSWLLAGESSLLRTPNPFFVPDFAAEFTLRPSICLRVGKLGKNIAPRFAHRYFDGWTLGAAVWGEDLLRSLRAAGLPWCKAVSFDRSCLVGNLQPIDTLNRYARFAVECGDARVSYDLERLRLDIHETLSLISRDNTLKTGDLIMPALTPCGIPLKPGMHLRAGTETDDIQLIQINIK